jgi:protein-S-isoprenylcysteine O-methyltransferase Ste14
MSANWLKRKVYKYISQPVYRLLYNIVALVLLILIGRLYVRIEHSILFSFAGDHLIGLILVFIGTVFGLISFRSYSTMEFLGLVKEKEHQHLSIGGMNRYVRHPLYLATLIVMLGFLFIEPTEAYLGLATIFTIYLFVGIRLEENKLIELFGEEYRNYQMNVPMFFPFIGKKHAKINKVK